MRTRLLLCAALAAGLSAFSFSPPSLAQPPEAPFPKGLGKGGGGAKAGELKKYDDVITKDFTTQPGVFAVHRQDDKVYFEIPQDKFGRLFLWRAEVAKGPGGGSWGGAGPGPAVLKLRSRGNKISARKVRVFKRSDGEGG